jgi:hypothetical protein
MVQAGDCLRVLNLAPADHADRSRERHTDHRDDFVRIELLRYACQISSEKQIDPFVAEAWSGEDAAQVGELSGNQAHFLAQLARRTSQRWFPGIQLPSRNLPNETARGMAILSHQRHLTIAIDRHDRRRAGVANDLQRHRHLVGQRDLFQAEVDDAALVDLLDHADPGRALPRRLECPREQWGALFVGHVRASQITVPAGMTPFFGMMTIPSRI